MATSEILLTEAIPGLGAEGEQVKVRSGFARNFLFPRRKAVPVNRANKKQIEVLQQRRAEREAKELEEANAHAKKLESISIAIPVKTGKGGKLFGAVTANDVAARLKDEGVELDKKQFSMPHPVKNLGKHHLRVKLHPDVTVDFSFEVVSENPIKEEKEEESK